ncbi:hypothetical protein F4780DRAFT_101199 [Xylariomycetidae sp. FL0641]|nr:hypothetical protein F4780DRAFT_101199 [Xylariomycetidae sp. FL0641]
MPCAGKQAGWWMGVLRCGSLGGGLGWAACCRAVLYALLDLLLSPCRPDQLTNPPYTSVTGTSTSRAYTSKHCCLSRRFPFCCTGGQLDSTRVGSTCAWPTTRLAALHTYTQSREPNKQTNMSRVSCRSAYGRVLGPLSAVFWPSSEQHHLLSIISTKREYKQVLD